MCQWRCGEQISVAIDKSPSLLALVVGVVIGVLIGVVCIALVVILVVYFVR